MDVREVSRGEIKLVGLEVVGRRQELSQRVPMAWLELTRGLEAIRHKVDPALFYGVSPESDHLHGGQSGVYSYWVATEVSAFESVPATMTTLLVPAQRYAVTTCKGGAEQIEPTYIGLAQWLAASGSKTRADAYAFELYDVRRQRPTPPYERFDYDIYRPLESVA
ncbi:GyrI-like domain-containing protein [Vitiosangium sp. GDMCC 1.1324]|uniref:GyrI-like domain-containing protein n=1 Tax=Vitiosangium sp. (strain GDMCC 1.1324) TaxID=2138576 RepID=UPI000D3DC907|nr:GyrI-like domain-containing protein [Vitiosangium sp. GDMCC 1.1324]PTL76730.1 AraC family transcriptional regulator [Vitiosangium sp. GDMCC 1.1324]